MHVLAQAQHLLLATAASTYHSKMQSPLVVHGGTDAIIALALRGAYYQHGENHGKPVFKKTQAPGEDCDVMCYFWDGHDNPSHAGWWFGPTVGDDRTWAYNSAAWKSLPPRVGWSVPWNTPVDPTFHLSGAGVGVCPTCGEIASDGCWQQMCKTHCRQTLMRCDRHDAPQQLAQDRLSRRERAPRKRGGKLKKAAASR